ncbi:MAG: hypothetical protein GY774_10125 [Planctomycetes bacterium]|nr:hypothetical protein [Planctomycetota bacterium]
MKIKIYLITLLITILSYSTLAEEPVYFADANLKAAVEETLDVNYPTPLNTIYVDDDAVNDPGPFDPQISDVDEDGSLEHPFDTIREAIDVAENGCAVLIYPGIYTEGITFSGKALTVQGIATHSGIPVLENPNSIAVAFENGEGPDSVLQNFVIRNSFMAVFIDDCSPTITNLTIVDNQYDIGPYDSAQPDISNCIIRNNINNNIFEIDACYSCIEGTSHGQGNFSLDPLFVDPDNGDYHLISEQGRYSPQDNIWIHDEITSPCIDAGDPDIKPLDEPLPNGDRINIGAYGGTPYASMSDSDLERPVYFADANLKAAVEETLGVTDPTPSDMLRLTFLYANDREISNLTGLEYATNLQNLGFRNNQINDISLLSGLTKLDVLNLDFNPLDDISPLSELINLRFLYMQVSQISDLSSLSNLTKLQSLCLGGNQISDLSPLSELTNLSLLWLPGNQINDLSPLAGLMSLEILYLQENQISDISALTGLTELTQLHLLHNQISDISALAGLVNLTNLRLENNQISDISALAGLTNLEVLYLAENQISDISILANLTNLTELLLEVNQINDISLSVLANLTNLTSLSLARNQISDISVLAGLTNLEKLWLYDNQISDISALTGLTNLTQLNLGTNQISDISVLSGMANMQYLTLNNNQISDISALTGLMNLKTLFIQNIPLNQDACDIYIPQILENNPGINIYFYPCSN